MFLNLNDKSNIPLQKQIYSLIKAKILSGSIDADYPLPSIRNFAKDHRISVITVQKAYEQLENDDLIYIKRNKGFFVKGLNDSERNKIATENLSKNLEPILRKAMMEGLDFDEIIKIINKKIEEIKVTI